MSIVHSVTKLTLLALLIFLNNSWASTCIVSPSNIYVGDSYTISSDVGQNLDSNYDVVISLNGSSSTINLLGGPRYWSKTVAASVATSFNIECRIYNKTTKALLTGSLGSASLTISGVPTVSSVSPTSVTAGKSTVFTVYGSNLPSTIAMSLEGSSICGSPYSVGSTSAKITCIPDVSGSKRFYVAAKSGSAAISGSSNLYVYVNLSSPTVSSVSPTSVTAGKSTVFTVYGSNLPSTIAMSLEGASICGSPYSVGSTSAKITCIPDVSGSKRFYVAAKSGAAAMSGSTNLYVNVNSSSPAVSSVSPTSVTTGKSTVFTVYGSNLPSTIAMSLEGSSICGSPYSVGSTSAKITCIPDVSGSKRFYVAAKSGSAAISGSSNLYVYVNLSSPTVSSVSPTSVTAGKSTVFTVYGSNLPSTIAMSLEGASVCGSPYSVGSTSAKITCIPDVSGSKRFYVAAKSGSAAMSGSTNLYVNVGSLVDNPPIVTINTAGSSSSNNPKTIGFNIDVGINDDLGLKSVVYEIFTSLSATTGLVDNAILSGKSGSTTFTIDLNNLAVGSYKVKIIASDTKPQASIPQWYWFQKEAPIVLPSVSLSQVRESGLTDVNKQFTFEAQLSQALPAGHGIFLNFDNLNGSWLADTDAGGHIPLLDQGGNVFATNTTLEKLGIRFYRVAIFDLKGDTESSNDVRVSDWSVVKTCTLADCLGNIPRPLNYGNPSVTGSGSELFKNVDVANGNYHLSKTDISTSGKGPSFAFSRAYNSLHKTPWTFAYEMKAQFLTGSFNRQISIGPREDGHMQYFFKDLVNKWHSLNPGDFDQLLENADGSLTLYTQGNRLYEFAQPDGVQAGRLQAIKDRLSNALSFTYDASNNLTGAVDANGRTYTITRDASNRIGRVTDFNGRYVQYSYDANNMITQVRQVRGDAFYDRYTYYSNSPTFLKTISNARILPGVQLTVNYTPDPITNDLYRVQTLTNIDGQSVFSYGESATWGVYTGVSQPAVDGINHNRVYIRDAGRIIKMYDAKSAAEALVSGDIVTTKSYKTALDNSRFADLALVTRINDPKNNNTDIVYDELVGRGSPKNITDANGRQTSATYTTVSGQINLTPMASVKQPGVTSTTRYASFTTTGKAKLITDPRNFSTNRRFDVNDWLSQSTNARNYSTAYTYDAYGNVTRVTDAKSQVTNQVYYNASDPGQLGRLKTETSALGLVTTYTYDEQGNILTRNESDGGSINYTTQYTYDASGNLSQVIDPLNHRKNYVYDNLNRKITENYTVDGMPYTRSYAYDAMGRLKSMTNELGQTDATHYTARNQVKYKVNPLLQTTVTYSYDKNGNVTTVTDAEGRVIATTYDELNRKIKVTDKQGNYQTWTYNTAGQVATHRDNRGKTSRYEYDATGNLIQLVDPEGGVTEMTYDGNGNLLSVIDPNSNTMRYGYDELDRRKFSALNNGMTWTYIYDANDNVLTETTPTGEKTKKIYDALNRVRQLTEIASDTSITRQIQYAYDANGNVVSESSGGNTISYTYDEINRVTSVTDTYGKTIAYAYDKAGNRTKLTYPGNKSITYHYDNADRLLSLTDWLNETTSYSRNKTGQAIQVNYGNGTRSKYTYNTIGQLTLLENLKADGSIISRHEMTLDAAGNITQSTMDLPLLPVLPPDRSTMTYDNNNRILNADNKIYNHDSSGRIIVDNDNVQTIYKLDINDHIRNISSVSQTHVETFLSYYAYDLNNNRISQTQNGIETRYVIDQLADLPNVVAETNSQGVVSHYYIYGEGLVAQIDDGNNSHYYHFDPTGHTLALTDASGNVSDSYAYTPYGFTTKQGSTHNPFLFVGKYGVMDDGNGLHYMRARYYKEEIKRFMSLDALHGNVMNPQSLNRYAYVLGNPVMGVDPSGLKNCKWYKGCFSWLGGIIYSVGQIDNSINNSFDSFDPQKTSINVKEKTTKIITSKTMNVITSVVIELSEQKRFLKTVKDMGSKLDLGIKITSLYKGLFDAQDRNNHLLDLCRHRRGFGADAQLACTEIQLNTRSKYFSKVDREVLPKLKSIYVSAIRVANEPTDWVFSIYEMMQELNGNESGL